MMQHVLFAISGQQREAWKLGYMRVKNKKRMIWRLIWKVQELLQSVWEGEGGGEGGRRDIVAVLVVLGLSGTRDSMTLTGGECPRKCAKVCGGAPHRSRLSIGRLCWVCHHMHMCL